MSYSIALANIASRVFVADVEFKLLLVAEKGHSLSQLKMFIVYIMGSLLSTRFALNGRSLGNTYVKIYKE